VSADTLRLVGQTGNFLACHGTKLTTKGGRRENREKASFAERGEIVLPSGEQNQAPFGESGEKIAPKFFHQFPAERLLKRKPENL